MSQQVITRSNVLSTYRTLLRLIKLLPNNQKPEQQLLQARELFLKNSSLTDEEEIRSCLKQAGEKIAYLRIVTPKKSSLSSSSSSANMRWIYTKDGPIQVDGFSEMKGTLRDGRRVVSNWDGNNLDPCSVKIHNAQLKRMGYVNNLHAKGLF
jgi:hypothetical protein